MEGSQLWPMPWRNLPQKIEIFEFLVFCTGNGNVENTDADLPEQSAERVRSLLLNRYICLFTKI